MGQAPRAENRYQFRASAAVEEQAPPDSGGFLMAAVVLVFVLGIGGFAWKYISGRNSTNAAAAKASPSAVSHAAPAKPQPVLAAIETAKPVAKTNPAETPKKEAAATQKLTSDAVPAVTKQTPTNPIQTSESKLNLDIKAIDSSWVQIQADGKTWEDTLSAGSAKSFHANKELIVKLGNAGAVELSYNGKALPKYPPETKTKTISFTTEPHDSH